MLSESIIRRVEKINKLLRCDLDPKFISDMWDGSDAVGCPTLVIYAPSSIAELVSAFIAESGGDSNIALPGRFLIISEEMGSNGTDALEAAVSNIKRRIKDEDGPVREWLKTNRQDPDYRINKVVSEVAELTATERTELLRRLIANS